MSFGLLAGMAILLLGYTFLYSMLKLWGGNSPGFANALLGGCA